MSDQILFEMSEKLGQIHGTVTALEKKQEDFLGTIRDHNDRIAELETAKHKAHGYILGVSTISAAIGSFFTHLWGK